MRAPTPVAPPRDPAALAFARNRRRERTRTGLAAIVGLIGILYAMVVVVSRDAEDEAGGGAAASRVELLRSGDSGSPAPPVTAGAAVPAGPVAISSFAGSAPNLYGGSRTSRCTAGASGQGRLTEVALLRDTRVTAFRSGLAPVQAILEAGTALLVDDFGVPRVRCAGLMPLAPPRAVASSPTYAGAAWPGFDPSALAVVVARDRVDTFVLVNLDGPGSEPLRRRPGERP